MKELSLYTRLKGREETKTQARERLKKVRQAAKAQNVSEAAIIRHLIDKHL